MTLGPSVAKIGRSCAEDAILALGIGEIARLQRAQHTEAHERDGLRDARLHRLAALALHELGGVLALGQRHDAQLELAPGGHLRGAQHRLLAGAVGIQRKLHDRRQARELADLLLGQRRAHDADAVAHADLVHRDDVGVALGDDDAAGLRRRRAREVGGEELAALVEEVDPAVTRGC